MPQILRITLGVSISSTIWTQESSHTYLIFLQYLRQEFRNMIGKTKSRKKLWIPPISSPSKLRPGVNISISRISCPTKVCSSVHSATIVPIAYTIPQTICILGISLILSSNRSGHIFLLPMCSSAQQVCWQISHLGISSSSDISIFLVIHTMTHSQ